MNEHERLTETLQVSVMIERNKQKAARMTAYVTLAEKAYRKFLLWNGRLMRYEQAERKREGWVMTHSKIKVALITESAWRAYKRCTEIYIRLVKDL